MNVIESKYASNFNKIKNNNEKISKNKQTLPKSYHMHLEEKIVVRNQGSHLKNQV